ncbi:MAG: helix-turn-helix domain-containing protein [Bdellovibrionales bacterium]|nr:helix-turn-helix domain-containing protein [Bdellovibrionales bacterium]
MKKGQDIAVKLPDLLIIHQKVPGRELGRHSHSEHEFFMPLQGEITVDNQQKSLKCGPGKMLYVPPNLEHSFSSSASGEGERVILLISDKKWKKSTTKVFTPTLMPLNSLVRELVFYILLNPQTNFLKTFSTALIESLIENLNVHKNFIEDEFSQLSSKVVDYRIKKVIEIIESNHEISISELAKQCGLSNRNLNKLFMQEVGTTPKNLIINNKINKAKMLLKTTNLTITDISFEVGYNSLSKFISTFQKYTGKLPSEFRNFIN